MASHDVTSPDVRLDATATAVIDTYLCALTRRLPRCTPLGREAVTEMRTDLEEATAALLASSPSPAAAARAAIARFGDIDEMAAAFRPELMARKARRVGLTLLVTGPLVGAAWLLAVFLTAGETATAWRWLPVVVAPLLLVGTPATLLTVASTGRLTRWLGPRTGVTSRAVAVAGLSAGGLDAILLVGSLVLLLTPVPAPSPLVALAAAASLARLVLVSRVTVRLWNDLRPAPVGYAPP